MASTRINSKRKGNNFEAKIAKLLSAWFYDGNENVLVRAPSSGSLATFRRQAGIDLTQPGDIIQIDVTKPAFPFSVEAKHYKKIEIDPFLMGNKTTPLRKFWDQCYRDADFTGKIPMLVFRQNNGPILVCVQNDHMDVLSQISNLCTEYMIGYYHIIVRMDDLINRSIIPSDLSKLPVAEV